MMRIISIFFTTLLLFLMFSCNRKEPVSALKPEKLISLAYGNDTRNVMDVYLPENRTDKTPFVLLIHGGGWIAGDKSYFSFLQDNLLNKGIASASINYRYISENIHYNELMSDINNAIHYIQQNALSWNIRNKGFIIGGHSAGAHMALLYAYSFDENSHIKSIISMAGPSDFFDKNILDMLKKQYPEQFRVIEWLANAKYEKEQVLAENFKLISPYWKIKNVPTLFIHGQKDELINYSQAEMLYNKLQDSKIKSKLVLIPEANHSFTNVPMQLPLIEKEITEWINSN